MKRVRNFKAIVAILLVVSFSQVPRAAEADNSRSDNFAVIGRWDLTIYDLSGVYPSWFEITETDGELAGRFQGRHSSCRPIRDIEFESGTLRIALPAYEYEREDKGDLVYTGDVLHDKIDGLNDQGIRFRALRVPELKARKNIVWGKAVNLCDGDDLSDLWMPRNIKSPNGWQMENGILSAEPPSTDLVTNNKFYDFILHVEFKVPPKSNSGVYLRGRYEIQISDDYGKEPDSYRSGGLYGFISPVKMMAKPAGEWNSWDITLIGRNLTLVFNGEKVIDNQEIPGITGSAINSREAEPGPIMLQCHSAPIYYRNIRITLPEEDYTEL